MAKPFAGKVALVTGASSGIGAATALAFARQGAKVVATARRVEQGEHVVREIIQQGGDSHFVRADVSQAADVEAMVQATLEKFGRLDCAVNNAGIAGPLRTPAAEIAEAQWDSVMNTNLKGAWLCMKHEIPALLSSGGGAIVNVASMYGLKPSDLGHAAYSASKHGLIGLTKTAAIDYGQSGLRINAVAPGFTRSEMVDPDQPGRTELIRKHSAMNRIGEAEEAAHAIVWLCSDAASYVNGAVLPVSGGDTTRMY